MKRNDESGQALLELAAALVGVLAVLMIVFFTAGVGIANLRTYLGARAAADRDAGGAEKGNAGSNIAAWNYPGYSPYTAQDRPRRGGSDAGATLRQVLNSAACSEGLWSNRYYQYLGLNELPDPSGRLADSPLRVRPAMFAAAAGLREGRAPRRGDAGDNIFYSKWDGDAVKGFQSSFGRWFGSDITHLDLAGQRVNRVYQPAMRARGH